MATIEQIKDYKICNIVEVTLEGILLELHLNISTWVVKNLLVSWLLMWEKHCFFQ